MSSYTIEKLSGEPIVLGTTHENWKAEVDIPLWADELYRLLDSLDEPVSYIGDLRAGRRWTLDEAIRTATAVARGDRPVFHHPKLREALIVTDQTLVNLGALGLQSDIFGNVPIKVFATIEEAFEYARSQ